MLFIMVVEEDTMKCRRGRGDPWKLLYLNYLVLTTGTKEEVELKFRSWKQGMEKKGFRVKMDNKMMVTGKNMGEKMQVKR